MKSTFSATMCFDRFPRARYTLPNLPFPIGLPMSKSCSVHRFPGPPFGYSPPYGFVCNTTMTLSKSVDSKYVCKANIGKIKPSWSRLARVATPMEIKKVWNDHTLKLNSCRAKGYHHSSCKMQRQTKSINRLNKNVESVKFEVSEA